jgi:hypothetical protein
VFFVLAALKEVGSCTHSLAIREVINKKRGGMKVMGIKTICLAKLLAGD